MYSQTVVMRLHSLVCATEITDDDDDDDFDVLHAHVQSFTFQTFSVMLLDQN